MAGDVVCALKQKNKSGVEIAALVLRIVLIVAMAYFGVFKLVGPEPTRALFTELGQEPVGRYFVGALEVGAAIFLLTKLYALGGVMVVGLMAGAIFAHLGTDLGIAAPLELGEDPQTDNGMLFGLGVVLLVFSVVFAWISRKDIPVVGSKLFGEAEAS